MIRRKKNIFMILAVLLVMSLIGSSIAIAGGNPSGASLWVLENESQTVTGVNKLIVNKSVVGSDYSGPFNLLIDNQAAPIYAGINDDFELEPGDYVVQEESSECWDADPSTAQNVAIAEGTDYISATIENYTESNMIDNGWWWIIKDDVVIDQGEFGPLSSGDTFTKQYIITAAGDYAIDFDAEATHPGTGGDGSAPVSGMTVNFGYLQPVPGDVTIDISNTYTCGDKDNPKLIVNKVFMNYPVDKDKSADVTVSGEGIDTANGSHIFDADGSWTVGEVIPGETYTISEEALVNVDVTYTSDEVTIVDGEFTIPEDQTEDVTITITNTFDPPSDTHNKLTIVKNFVYYAENDKPRIANFELIFTSPDPDVSKGSKEFNNEVLSWALTDLTPGSYKLQETTVANVTVTFASQDVDINTDGEFIFPEDHDADVTIYVTNTYNPPQGEHHSYLQIKKELKGDVPNPEPSNFWARIEKWVEGTWTTFLGEIRLFADQTTEQYEVDAGYAYRVVEYTDGGADSTTYSIGDVAVGQDGVVIGLDETKTITVTNRWKDNPPGGDDDSYIVVRKNVKGDGPKSNFEVTIYKQSATSDNWVVERTFDIDDGESVYTEVDPGTYRVVETDGLDADEVAYTLNGEGYDPDDVIEVDENETQRVSIANTFKTEVEDEDIIIPEEPPVVTPPQEPVVVPEQLPELPKTGANSILFMAAGLLLAGGGMFLRKRS